MIEVKTIEDYKYEEALKIYRSKNEDLAYEAEKSFDKYILSLASGALALSLTAVSSLFKFREVSIPILLFIAWILFAVTILTTLLSLKTSSIGHRKIIEQIDADSFLDGKGIGEPWMGRTQALNRASLLFFLFGLVIVFVFIGINLNNGKDGKDMKNIFVERSKLSLNDEKGTTPVLPPPMPTAPSNP